MNIRINDVVLSQSELAKKLNISRGTIKRWAIQGYITPIKTVNGRIIGFSAFEIECLQNAGNLPQVNDNHRTRKTKILEGLQVCMS